MASLYRFPKKFVATTGLAVLVGLWFLPAWPAERMSAGLFRTRAPGAGSLEGMAWIMQRARQKVVFHVDDPTTTVTVKVPTQSTGRPAASIYTNGKSDGSLEGDYATMALVALIPCMIAESCNDAFVIGYGTGVTAGEFAALDSMKSVPVAEISRGVIEAAPFFDAGNLGASQNPKVQVQRTDAYRALLRSEETYDVIASEPSNPWVSGVEMLFSQEFLEAARDRLRPGGVYAQWFHTYETDRESLELVLRTYAAVFDRVAVWTVQGVDLLLLGLMPGAELDLDRMHERFQQEDLAAGLRRAGISTFPQLLTLEMLPLGVIEAAELSGDIHTLLHPRLSDRAARAFFAGKQANLPPTAGGAAAEVGARNSLLRQWIEREGGLTPELRSKVVATLCPGVARLCATVLARWQHDEPESPELAAALQRYRGAIDPQEVRALARFFDDGIHGQLTPAQARRATEQFGLHYHHAVPFEREALDATWRRCRAADCWAARREEATLLGGPGTDDDTAESEADARPTG